MKGEQHMENNIQNIALLYNLDIIEGKRVIPIQNRSVSGRFYSRKNNRLVDYESTLERDYFYALEFDEHVVRYEEQPFGVIGHYNGRKVTYHPDVIVLMNNSEKPLIIEVKYLSDLDATDKKDKIINKLNEMDKWAKKNGATHQLMTEKEIRNIRLNNQKFLYGYIEPRRRDAFFQEKIYHLLNFEKQLRAVDIVDAYSSDEMIKAEIIPTIWHMLVNKKLLTDLDVPLTMYSILEVNNG